MDPPPQPQRSATRSYRRATDTMSLVTAVRPDIFSQMSYQSNPQGRVAAFLQAHHHVWVSRAPGRAFTYWRLNASISNHWTHWAQLGAIGRWRSSKAPTAHSSCVCTGSHYGPHLHPFRLSRIFDQPQPPHHEDTVATSVLQ